MYLTAPLRGHVRRGRRGLGDLPQDRELPSPTLRCTLLTPTPFALPCDRTRRRRRTTRRMTSRSCRRSSRSCSCTTRRSHRSTRTRRSRRSAPRSCPRSARSTRRATSKVRLSSPPVPLSSCPPMHLFPPLTPLPTAVHRPHAHPPKHRALARVRGVLRAGHGRRRLRGPRGGHTEPRPRVRRVALAPRHARLPRRPRGGYPGTLLLFLPLPTHHLSFPQR